MFAFSAINFPFSTALAESYRYKHSSFISHSVQCCWWVTKSCPTLCNPMDCSTPGFPVLHHLRVCSNSCPLSWWCHPTISSSVVPFSSCPQSFPTSGSFPMSRFFASGGQSIGASASVLPMNIQDWFPLGLPGFISLLSKGLSRVFSNITVQSINSSALSFLYSPTLRSIHGHWKCCLVWS